MRITGIRRNVTRLHYTEFPEQERYGLASQMRRAAVSLPANIAEGYGRLYRGDYVHHLSTTRASLAELVTHVTIAVRLGFVQRDAALPLRDMTQNVGQMLTKRIQSLNRQEKESPTPGIKTKRPKL